MQGLDGLADMLGGMAQGGMLDMIWALGGVDKTLPKRRGGVWKRGVRKSTDVHSF